VEKIQRAGIKVTGGFIVGFDTDSPDIFERQIDFIQRAGIPTAMIGLLTALPNTQLWRRLEKEGRLLKATSGNNTHDLKTNFRPNMPEETLVKGYKRLLSELYSPRRYFERCLTLLRRLPAQTKVVRKVNWLGIRALLLSICRQAFSSYGFFYLRYMITVLRKHLRIFPDAVALAIRGYHFFRMTAEILRADAFTNRLKKASQVIQARISEILHIREKGLAVTMERNVLKLLGRFQKRYRRFNRDMQQYLQETFADFARQCQSWIVDLSFVT
jgi:hypothetical protein